MSTGNSNGLAGRDGERWRSLAKALSAYVAASGVTKEPGLLRAVASVPRHAFVPGFFESVLPPRWVGESDPGWLEAIYADNALITQLVAHPDQPDAPMVASSSSQPSLMVHMLDLLDLPRLGLLESVEHGPVTVLEIGTGTGYNAALLAYLLGGDNVTSVDIDSRLTKAAIEHLRVAGFAPTVATSDGEAGYPARAPYDRIIATHAVEAIPRAWVEQVRPGGLIVADVRSAGLYTAGALARLRVGPDGSAEGRLTACPGVGFMAARSHADYPDLPPILAVDQSSERRHNSHLGYAAIDDAEFAFALWQALPGIVAYPGADHGLILTPDGSWAEITRPDTPASAAADAHEVRYGGPVDLWATAERVAAEFHHERQSRPYRTPFDTYRITVTTDGQAITTDQPD